MNDEQTIQEEAGLSDKWKVVDSAPIMMLKQPPGAGVQSGPGDYFAGPTDPTLQHDSNATKSKTAGGAIPEYSLMPTGAANAPNNAAIKSVISQSISEITKSAASSSAAATFTPCTKVNYQTTEDYTVQLSDLAGIISIGNSAGGTITLPSPSAGAAPGTLIQAVYGGGAGAGASAALTNTSGSGMIAVVFTSPNVTLGTVSVSDSAGNKWIPITTNSGDSELMCTFYCAKVPGGLNAVTAVVPFFPPTPPPDQHPFFTFIAVYEVAGLVKNGLDQFSNGVGNGNSAIQPTKASTVAFTFAQVSDSPPPNTPVNFSPGPGWTAVSPGLTNIEWQYPAYAGGTPGGFWVGIGEYIINPSKGVLISGTATGPAVADANFTMANFSIAPSAIATGFTSCWYAWIENTGTAPYFLESASTIDGSVDSVTIGPNEGLMVVYDGTNWVTERGLGGGATGVTSLNTQKGDLTLTAGAGITISDTPGIIEISATAVGETAQTLWSWPDISSTPSTMNPVNGSGMNFTSNQVKFMYVHIDVPIQVGHFSFSPDTGDATHHYDWGLYDLSGTLIWNLGATIFAGTGLTTTALVQGTVTIQPGDYWLAFTGDGTGITFLGVTPSSRAEYYFYLNSVSGTPVWWTSATTSTGGTLTGLNPSVPAAPTTAGNLSSQTETSDDTNSFPVIALST